MRDVYMERVIRNLKRFVGAKIAPFRTDDEILEKALWLFELRNDLKFHNLVLDRAESISLERNATVRLHRRLALGRSPDAVVQQDDFLKAIQMETEGSWSGTHKSFGFSTSQMKISNCE